MTQDRVWSGVHDAAPTDDEGRPIHPEKGYLICGHPKTDAKDKNGRKREDVPYCLQSAGWGTDRDTGACKSHGGAGGAPEGWKNGNAKHLLYSQRMNEDDREIYEGVVRDDDGNLIGVEEMAEMLASTIAWEYTRLVRAVDKTPGVEMKEKFTCPECGETHFEAEGDCDGAIRVGKNQLEPCPYSGPFERVDAWVEFGDKAVERKEGRLANLMATYKQIAQGQDVNVTGKHDVDVTSDGEPLDVSINAVAMDLPEDEQTDATASDDEDADD